MRTYRTPLYQRGRSARLGVERSLVQQAKQEPERMVYYTYTLSFRKEIGVATFASIHMIYIRQEMFIRNPAVRRVHLWDPIITGQLLHLLTLLVKLMESSGFQV